MDRSLRNRNRTEIFIRSVIFTIVFIFLYKLFVDIFKRWDFIIEQIPEINFSLGLIILISFFFLETYNNKTFYTPIIVGIIALVVSKDYAVGISFTLLNIIVNTIAGELVNSEN